MTSKDEKTQFSAYVLLNGEKNRMFFSNNNPDEPVKYGKYEMRIRNKIQVENGYVTKVKWYGIETYAYPYLWKADKSDSDYQESWGNPRVEKVQKVEKKPKSPKIQKKNRGRKMKGADKMKNAQYELVSFFYWFFITV